MNDGRRVDELDRWLVSPHTRTLCEEAKESVRRALDVLLRACDGSQDANVRALKARYDGLNQTLQMLERGKI